MESGQRVFCLLFVDTKSKKGFWKIVSPNKQERAEKYFLPILRIIEGKYSRYNTNFPLLLVGHTAVA